MKNWSPPKRNPKEKKSIYLDDKAMRLKNAKGKLGRTYFATKSQYHRQKFTQCKNSIRAMTRKLRRYFEKMTKKDIETSQKFF